MAGDDLAAALLWIASGPQFTSVSCTVHCRSGGEPQRDQRLMHRVSGHTRVEDLRTGAWSLRTPLRWWSGGERRNEVLTGQKTRHGLHAEIEFIMDPTEFIQWASGVSAAGPTTIATRRAVSLRAHWKSVEDQGTPMMVAVEASGLILAARVPGTPPYPDPWMDFFVDDVIIDADLDEALFQWTAGPHAVLHDFDAEPPVEVVGLAAAASGLPFPLFVPREPPSEIFVHGGEQRRGPRVELMVRDEVTREMYHLVEGRPLLGSRTGQWEPVAGHPGMRRRRRQVAEVSGPSGPDTLGMADRTPYQVALELDGVDVVLGGYKGFEQLTAVAGDLLPFREQVVELVELSP